MLKYEIITDFDVYEQFEKPLVEAGWDCSIDVKEEVGKGYKRLDI